MSNLNIGSIGHEQGKKAVQQFEALFNHATMGIVIINQKGEITLVNNFALNQFGYEKEELPGKKIEALIPARFQHQHLKHRQRYNDHMKNRPMGLGLDLYGTKKDGKEFPVEISLGHYEIEGEAYVMAFISDITKRKEQEEAIIKLNASLEKKVSERTESLKETLKKLEFQFRETEVKDAELTKVNSYLSNILNYAGAMIIVVDLQGLIKLFNRAAEKSLGYDLSEIIDQHNSILFYQVETLPPDTIFGLTVRLFENNPDSYQQGEQEYVFIRKDGSQFPVSVSLTGLNDGDGIRNGYMAIIVDITQRRNAEQELRNSLEKERELGELKSRFVSMASHEFRTPLSTVLSSAFLLSKYTTTDDQPKREKHISRIISSVNMLTDILNDFLSVGKIEEGKINVRWRQFNLPVYIEEILQEIKGIAKPGQVIIYEHAGEEMAVLDPAIMKHIVLNLLSNAIKFSQNDQKITLLTNQTVNQISLIVKDGGIGISQEDKEHLFERFFRSTNVSNIQGTGLGLHLVGKYAELMNGSVECKSKLKAGTEFIITFNKKMDIDEKDSAN